MRSAGDENAIKEGSKNCRDFLKAMRETKCKVVLTSEIKVEWKKNLSKYARKWWSFMTKSGRITYRKNTVNDDLRKTIENSEKLKTDKRRNAALKDAILIEAALATDEAVVSQDDHARRDFKVIAGEYKRIKSILWINPVSEEDNALEWLNNGARKEDKLLLGFQN